jgi:hypothetical protein
MRLKRARSRVIFLYKEKFQKKWIVQLPKSKATS